MAVSEGSDMAEENDDRQVVGVGGPRCPPPHHLQGSLVDLAHQVADLQEEIGNFPILMSLGAQALQTAQRAVVVEYQLTMAQEEMARQRGEYEQQLDELRQEVERRDVNFQHHQQALIALAALWRQVLDRQGERAPRQVESS